MRLLLLGVLYLAAGCEVPCKVSSQCEAGERCSPSGACIQGCATDADCNGARSVCDRQTGLCRLTGG